jgi:precorrin-2/cobalt-factor-2 C20-methyltransferase
MTPKNSSSIGCLYGIGLGPGDPELVTMKASRLLFALNHVFAPKADEGGLSIARGIASFHMSPEAQVHELVYPMTRDRKVLDSRWRQAARAVIEVLEQGEDAGFITLGDPMLYSTCSYLVRAVQELLPSVEVEIVPGVTSFSASAALTQFILGERKSTLTVAPTPDSEEALHQLLEHGGRLVLMKVGARLPQLVGWLRARGLVQRARLVVRAGLPGQQLFRDLEACANLDEIGYLSTLLVDLEGDSAT